MLIGRVVGSVVSTEKHRKFEGAKLLLVQPLDLDGTPRGVALLAVDGAGAGVHETVLVVLEGRSAGEVLGKKAAPVDAAIVGIIDEVDLATGALLAGHGRSPRGAAPSKERKSHR
jgi:ethanolamine utilization protein EutN